MKDFFSVSVKFEIFENSRNIIIAVIVEFFFVSKKVSWVFLVTKIIYGVDIVSCFQ